MFQYYRGFRAHRVSHGRAIKIGRTEASLQLLGLDGRAVAVAPVLAGLAVNLRSAGDATAGPLSVTDAGIRTEQRRAHTAPAATFQRGSRGEPHRETT